MLLHSPLLPIKFKLVRTDENWALKKWLGRLKCHKEGSVYDTAIQDTHIFLVVTIQATAAAHAAGLAAVT
jgi:hypothetical protein